MSNGLFKVLKFVQAVAETASEIERALDARQSGSDGSKDGRQSKAEAFEQMMAKMADDRRREKQVRKAAIRGQREAFEAIRRELREALRPVRTEAERAIDTIDRPFRASAIGLKERRALLRIEPEREPLFDRDAARTAFAEARQAIEAARDFHGPAIEAAAAPYRNRAAQEARAFDPSGALAAEWLDRLEEEEIAFSRTTLHDRAARATALLASLEAELAALAREIEGDGVAPGASGSAPDVLGSLRHDSMLRASDLQAIDTAIRNPSSARLAAVIAGRVEAGNAADEADTALFLSEAFERAVAIHALDDMGYSQTAPMPALRAIAAKCVAAIEAIGADAVPLDRSNGVRVARALALAGECRRPARADAPGIGGRIAAVVRIETVPDANRAQAAVLAELVDRFEANALATIARRPSDRDLRNFTHHHFEVLEQLRRAIGLTEEGPAQTRWREYLAERAARRAEIVARVSPFWRPIFEQLIDMAPPGERSREAAARAALAPFETMDETAKAVVLAEVRTLRHDNRMINSYNLISRAGVAPPIRREGNGWGHNMLPRLQALLESTPKEQAQYFAPPSDAPEPGAFSDMAASFGGRGRASIVERDIEPLVVEGRFAEAERVIRSWLEQAPASQLRDTVLAADWERMSLSGWAQVDRWVAQPGTTAIGLDLSGHVTGNIARETDPVAFETSRYADRIFADSTTETLRALSRGRRDPWRGEFEEVDTAVAIVGQAPVILLLEAFRRAPRFDWPPALIQQHRAVERLAMLWCYVCANRLVAREIATRPPARPLPFVVGDHDFAAFPSVVHASGDAGR